MPVMDSNSVLAVPAPTEGTLQYLPLYARYHAQTYLENGRGQGSGLDRADVLVLYAAFPEEAPQGGGDLRVLAHPRRQRRLAGGRLGPDYLPRPGGLRKNAAVFFKPLDGHLPHA